MPTLARRRALPALLLRRLEAFETHIGPALEGEVTGVHQARVASRRLREAIPIVARDVPKKARRRASRAARRITRALGPVRELDVALALVAELSEAHPDLAPALDRVAEAIGGDRAVRRTTMLEALDTGAIADVSTRIRGLAGAHADDALSLVALGTRIARRAGGLRAAIADAGVLYDHARLHQVRIAAKQLRYGLEIAGEVRAGAVAASLARLKRVQDILGELNDRVVLGAAVTAARDREAGADLRAMFARLGAALDLECRLRHARYLRRRPALLAAAIDAEDRIALRVMERAASVRARQRGGAFGVARLTRRRAEGGGPDDRKAGTPC
ncbi:MAG: CHAD domain-containing protein [Vicinamibacteraceae bacterium]|nr:CHAD domain-containing protein [Vicinamibacteraceae bacterium]